MTNTRLAYTTSTKDRHNLAIARVAAAGRIAAEREKARREEEKAWQRVDETGVLVTKHEEYCFICSRATDHTGEHTPEQIEAWKARRWF
jgi:hypothetical protein